MGIEAHGFSQFCLPLVEGPESFGLQCQRASHMQRIKRAYTQRRAVTAGQVDDGVPGSYRKLLQLQVS